MSKWTPDSDPLIEYSFGSPMVCDWQIVGIVNGDSIDLGDEWEGTMEGVRREAKRRGLAYENETGLTVDSITSHQRSRWRQTRR